MNLTEMKAKPINELVDIAESLGIEDVGRLKKQEIIFRIFKQQAKEGVDIYGGGVLEILNDGYYSNSKNYFNFQEISNLLKKHKEEYFNPDFIWSLVMIQIFLRKFKL